MPAPRSLFERAQRPRDEVRGAPKAQRERLTRTGLVWLVGHVVLVVIVVLVSVRPRLAVGSGTIARRPNPAGTHRHS